MVNKFILGTNDNGHRHCLYRNFIRMIVRVKTYSMKELTNKVTFVHICDQNRLNPTKGGQ